MAKFKVSSLLVLLVFLIGMATYIQADRFSAKAAQEEPLLRLSEPVEAIAAAKPRRRTHNFPCFKRGAGRVAQLPLSDAPAPDSCATGSQPSAGSDGHGTAGYALGGEFVIGRRSVGIAGR